MSTVRQLRRWARAALWGLAAVAAVAAVTGCNAQQSGTEKVTGGR